MRTYRFVPYKYKKRRRNKIIAFFAALILAITGGVTLSKNNKKIEVFPMLAEGQTFDNHGETNTPEIITTVPTETPTPTLVPTPEVTINPVKDGFNMGDSVITIDEVNMRLNTSTKSYKMGSIPANTTVDRILTKDGFDLVRYNGRLAFVSTDFTNENVADINNEYYKVEDYTDIAIATTGLNFRLGPSINEPYPFTLDKNEEVAVIGKVKVNNDNDLWYLVRARGEIGFICAKYTKSMREEIKKMDPNIGDVVVQELAYLPNSAKMYDQNGKQKQKLKQFQLVKILAEYDNTYLVTANGKVGYVYKNNVKRMANAFILVDISTQRIYYFYRNDVAHRGNCTTGADKTPTKPGLYYPNVEKTGHRFTEEHSAHLLWRAWGLEGLHDADWEPEECFGDPEYRKSHGSLGCVRLPNGEAIYVRTYTPSKAPVLIEE